MILKASQRGGGRQLATHLLRTDENEHVEVHEIRGFMSEDLTGALNEAYAVSRGTRCKQFLFSVSLNPPQDRTPEIAVFENALSRIEERTGLGGQPRVLVFHEKQGRRHMHAVWSRIDAETMKAVQLSHFKLKLRDVSRSLYLDHDLGQMPRGLMNSAEKDPRGYTLHEHQEAKRKGANARDLKEIIQECWAVSDSKAAFEQALGARGLVLARGDRRSHVAITHDGQVASIARYTGKRAKDVRAKLGEADALIGVDEAKTRIAQDMTAAFQRHFREARENKKQELENFAARRALIAEQHKTERAAFDARLAARQIAETKSRSDRLNKGLKGLWQKMTGAHGRIRKENEAEALACFQRDAAERHALIERQLAARRELQAEIDAARRRHAGLVKELRKDREQVRQIAPNLRSPDAKQIEPAREAVPDNGQSNARDPNDNPIAPDMAERLRAMREGDSRPPRERPKAPEIER